MPRRSPREGRREQLNVRLTDEQSRVLAAIQFMDGLSAPEVIRQLLDEEVQRRLNDKYFVDTMRTREEYIARRDGTVTDLPRADDAS